MKYSFYHSQAMQYLALASRSSLKSTADYLLSTMDVKANLEEELKQNQVYNYLLKFLSVVLCFSAEIRWHISAFDCIDELEILSSGFYFDSIAENKTSKSSYCEDLDFKYYKYWLVVWFSRSMYKTFIWGDACFVFWQEDKTVYFWLASKKN